MGKKGGCGKIRWEDAVPGPHWGKMFVIVFVEIGGRGDAHGGGGNRSKKPNGSGGSGSCQRKRWRPWRWDSTRLGLVAEFASFVFWERYERGFGLRKGGEIAF